MKEGVVRTTIGDIAPESLGWVLPHEHLKCTQLAVFVPPKNDAERCFAHVPVSEQQIDLIREDPLQNLDNIYLPGGDVVQAEVNLFRQSGGGTIVDLTTVGLGRDVHEAARIGEQCGINVVVATGYYVSASHSSNIEQYTEEQLTAEMLGEIEHGIGGSSIRAGVIGEIGTSSEIHMNERKVLRAAAFASNESGCAIVVHVQPPAWLGHEVLDLLLDAGASADRVALAHMDTALDTSYHAELLDRGTHIMYDGFGLNWDFKSLGLEVPSDGQRVDAVMSLLARGYGNHIMMSHDVCTKIHLSRFGGPGYAHLFTQIAPMLRAGGCSDTDLERCFGKNPATFFAARKIER